MSIAPIDAPGLQINMTAVNGTANMKVSVTGWNQPGTKVITFATTGTPIIRNQWNRILIPVKQSTNNKKIRVNGVDEALTVTTFSTIDPVILQQGFGSDDVLFFALGSAGPGVAGGNYLVGAMYHPWFDCGSGKYFDDETKFWNGSGSPADLGATGNTPTGVAPQFYLPNGPATAGNNAGSGGNLVIVGSFAGITPPT